MTISPLFKGKFQKAIILCGGMTTMSPEESAVIATRAIASLVVEDHIKATEGEAIAWINSAVPEVKQYLMSVNADRFAKLMANANIRMGVFPHLFADGIVIPKTGFAVLDTGNYNQVPVIFTSGLNEFKSKANDDPYFNDLDANVNDPQKAAEYEFTNIYGDLLFGYLNAEKNAQAYSSVSGQPKVYASRMLWGSDPAIVGRRASILVGGGHGMDYYLWQNMEPGAYTVSDQIFSPSNRPGRYELGGAIRAYFANFIRTGDPNGSSLPEWQSWSNIEGGPKMLIFDADMEKAKIAMTTSHTVEADVFRRLLADNSLPADRRSFLVENILNGRFFSENLDAFWMAQNR
jgi:para-nitrobenzyl esterase